MLKMVKTFVLYVGVRNVRDVDIDPYIKGIRKKMSEIQLPEDSILIILPNDSIENRMVCIDPEYITEEELKVKHNVLLYELNENMKKLINDI